MTCFTNRTVFILFFITAQIAHYCSLVSLFSFLISFFYFINQLIFSRMTKHTHWSVKRFSALSVEFSSPKRNIQKNRSSVPRHIPFRLLLVRARKFIIHDPPRVRAASKREKGDRQAPASFTHPLSARCMRACMRACIASVVLIHARMHIYTWDRAARCITLLIEYRPLLGRMFPPVSVGVYYAPGTPAYHIRYIALLILCTRNGQLICSAPVTSALLSSAPEESPRRGDSR